MNTATKRATLALLASLLMAHAASARAQTTGTWQQFIDVLRVTPRFQQARDWTDRESAVVTRHIERLAKAAADGQVILAGRTSEA
jgi:hypothetical protein